MARAAYKLSQTSKSSSFNVQFNQAQLKDVHHMLDMIGKSAGGVISRAANKTMTGARTDATNEIGKAITAKKKVIREKITIKKMSKDRLKGHVRTKSKPLGLINFLARQTKKGASVKVDRSDPRKVVPRSFIRTVRSVKNVWWREKKHGSRALVGRLPIERLTGPRIPDILERKTVMRSTMGLVEKRAAKNLDYELSREIKRYG